MEAALFLQSDAVGTATLQVPGLGYAAYLAAAAVALMSSGVSIRSDKRQKLLTTCYRGTVVAELVPPLIASKCRLRRLDDIVSRH